MLISIILIAKASESQGSNFLLVKMFPQTHFFKHNFIPLNMKKSKKSKYFVLRNNSLDYEKIISFFNYSIEF